MDHSILSHNVQPEVASKVTYCRLNLTTDGTIEQVPQFDHDFLSMVISSVQFHGAT